jgi:hypothetical protein
MCILLNHKSTYHTDVFGSVEKCSPSDTIICIIHFHTNNSINFKFVGFEVLTAVVMKTFIFWGTTARSPLEVNQRFGRTCCPIYRAEE